MKKNLTYTSRDGVIHSPSSSKPSKKPIDDTLRECLHDPSALTPLGAGYNPEGAIFHCPICDLVGKIGWDDIETLEPLKFNHPLRGK